MNGRKINWNEKMGKVDGKLVVLTLCIILVLVLVGLLVYHKVVNHQTLTNQLNNGYYPESEESQPHSDGHPESKGPQPHSEEVNAFNMTQGDEEIVLEELKISNLEAVTEEGNVFIEGEVENTAGKKLNDVTLQIDLFDQQEKKMLTYHVVIPEIEAGAKQKISTSVSVNLIEIGKIEASIVKEN